jgi:hypothetical protein
MHPEYDSGKVVGLAYRSDPLAILSAFVDNGRNGSLQEYRLSGSLPIDRS